MLHKQQASLGGYEEKLYMLNEFQQKKQDQRVKRYINYEVHDIDALEQAQEDDIVGSPQSSKERNCVLVNF